MLSSPQRPWMEPVSPEAIFLQGGEDKGEAWEEGECD